MSRASFVPPCRCLRSSRHNGAALSVIQSCIAALPEAKSIAYFDTSFHRPIPPHIANYAIDQAIAKKRGLKKYGFHGLSCMSFPTRLA